MRIFKTQASLSTNSINIFFAMDIMVFLYNSKETHQTWDIKDGKKKDLIFK